MGAIIQLVTYFIGEPPVGYEAWPYAIAGSILVVSFITLNKIILMLFGR